MFYSIKYAQLKDIPIIVPCHKKAFPAALSSKMGHRYLRKMLSWYLSNEKTFLFYVEHKGKCIGYCGGMVVDGTLKTGSASGMLQFSFKDAILAILTRPWLWLHPELLKKWKLIMNNVLARFQSNKNVVQKNKHRNDSPYTGLIVIGVHPDFQGKGAGKTLLEEFDRVALKNGISRLGLTVKKNNLRAINAYKKNGWFETRKVGVSLIMNKILKERSTDGTATQDEQ